MVNPRRLMIEFTLFLKRRRNASLKLLINIAAYEKVMRDGKKPDRYKRPARFFNLLLLFSTLIGEGRDRRNCIFPFSNFLKNYFYRFIHLVILTLV